MPLDPQCAAVVEFFDSLGMGNAHKVLPIDEFRACIEPPEADRYMERAALASVEDHAIPGPAGEIPIRIYRAQEAQGGAVPLLLYFHGGGFVIGSLDSHDNVCCLLTRQAGCVTVAVDYRLAPEHVFPGAVDDAEAALHWAVANATELGIDPRCIVVGGDSAGANLAAAIALRAQAAGGPAIALQLLAYPVTDLSGTAAPRLEHREGYFLTAEIMDWFTERYLPDASRRLHPHASPLLAADLAGLPRAHIVTAEYDPLCAEGEAYAMKLHQAGVPVYHKRYDGTIHGFVGLYGMIDKGREAIAEFAASIRRLAE